MNNYLPKGTSDEHYTPKSLFDKLGLVFDLDVASPVDSVTFVPAKKFYTKLDDGLNQDWFGNVWMNPPFSKPTDWVKKFIKHNFGIALLPMTRGKWWDEIWNAADAILPLEYNHKFVRPDNLPSKPIVFRTALYAIGEINVKALANFEGKIR